MTKSLLRLERIHPGDFLACAWLVALAALLFRNHLLRKLTFLGNPDRIQNNLKLVKFYVDSLAQGGLQAWNEHEFLGYDSFALPYINPNPLTYLYAAFGADHLYVTAGYVSALLLAAAGVGAYFFLRAVVGQRLPAAVGASLYMLSSIAVLKVSQNDASFLAFVLMPLLMLALRSMHQYPSIVWAAATQAGLLYLMIQFVFLQKVAYVLMLWGAYALFLALSRRSADFVVVPGLAFVCALIAALPRIVGVALGMKEHSRGSADASQLPIGVNPYELFRWLDNTIFGSYFGEAVWRQNFINLSEGVLLYTAAMVPFVIALGAVFRQPVPEARAERRFFTLTLIALLAVVSVPWLIDALWRLFGKISFLHGRILIAGLLPVVALVALVLADLQRRSVHRGLSVAWGLIGAVALVYGIELLAQQTIGTVAVSVEKEQWLRETFEPVAPTGWTPTAFSSAALVRIGLSAAVAMGLVLLARRGRTAGAIAYVALAGSVVLQALVASNFQLNGPHTWSAGFPFGSGNISWIAPDRFIPPSPEQRAALHRLTDDKNYRSVVICEPRIAGGFCAGHVSEYWKLRLAEGYYGVGAPTRVRALPWEGGVGMRDLSFSHHRGPQWPLLGALNVRSAIGFTPEVYGYGQPRGGIQPSQVIRNPAPVLPRAFFAAQVMPVGSAPDAALRMFDGAIPRDLARTSFVEGLTASSSYEAGGKAEVTGTGDRLVVSMDPAPQPRFLVLNELFNPRWTARANGQSLKVHPTNAVMRGVKVPGGVTQVEFIYQPVMTLANCAIALLAASLTFVFGIRLLRK